MGLWISGYSQMRYLGDHGDTDEDFDRCDEAGHIRPYFNPTFPGRAHPLLEGCYERTPETEEVEGFSGPYSSYNTFRAWIARVIVGVEPEEIWEAPERYAESPFVELINFADNEGTIGPIASSRICRAFSGCRGALLKRVHLLNWPHGAGQERVDAMREAFRVGSLSAGFVRFW